MPEFAILTPDEAMQVVGGAVAPLAAVLLVPLAGSVAFAVDLGYVSLTRGELQNHSESSALAGARR